MDEFLPLDEGVSPIESIGRTVLWHWRTIIVFALIGLAGAATLSKIHATTYSASAQLVTGTYSLPASIGSEAAVNGAGPLGLELPADTQARIISSPTVVDLAVDALGSRVGDVKTFVSSAHAVAVTENSFTVSSSGSSPSEAAVRTNALAQAYLTYRERQGRSTLLALTNQATADAKSKNDAATRLDAAITAAAGKNAALAQALVQRQQALIGAASDLSVRASALSSAASSFDGGGNVVSPAAASDAVSSANLLRLAIFGLGGGLLVGFATALVSEKVSGRIRSAEEAARAARAPVVLIVHGRAWREASRSRGGRGRPRDGAREPDIGFDRSLVLAVRAIERRRKAAGLSGTDVVIRPVTGSPLLGPVTRALARGYAEASYRVAVVTADTAAAHDAWPLSPASVNDREVIESPAADSAGTVTAIGVIRDVDPAIIVRSSARDVARHVAVWGADVVLWETASHFAEDTAVWPPESAGSLLVVRTGADRARIVRQATDELSESGFAPVAVILLARPASRRARVSARTAGEESRQIDEHDVTEQEIVVRHDDVIAFDGPADDVVPHEAREDDLVEHYLATVNHQGVNGHRPAERQLARETSRSVRSAERVGAEKSEAGAVSSVPRTRRRRMW